MLPDLSCVSIIQHGQGHTDCSGRGTGTQCVWSIGCSHPCGYYSSNATANSDTDSGATHGDGHIRTDTESDPTDSYTDSGASHTNLYSSATHDHADSGASHTNFYSSATTHGHTTTHGSRYCPA